MDALKMETDLSPVSDGITRESATKAETASSSSSSPSSSSSSPSLTRPTSAQVQLPLPLPGSATVSVSQTAAAVDKHSSPNRQSAPKSAHQPSSSTQSSVTSPHHRNNPSTAIPPPTNLSSPRPSETPNPAQRPSSSPPPSPSPSPSPSQLLPSRLSHSSSTPSSYFSPRTGASGLEPRSLPNKRQPASRSSHGIETSNGPPPALITQRSYTAESVRKHPTPIDVAAARPHRKRRSETGKSVDSVIHLAPLPTDDKNSFEPSKATRRIRREAEPVQDDMAAATAGYGKHQMSLQADQDSTLRNLDRTMSSNSAAAHAATPNFAAIRHGEEQSKATQEDLFLLLARSNSLTDNTTAAAAKSERKRVGVGVIYSFAIYASWQHLRSIIG